VTSAIPPPLDGTAPPDQRQPIGPRAALPIGACLLSAAGLSWARDLVAGSLGLDDRRLALAHRIWPFVLFGCLAAVAGRLYLGTLRRAAGRPWPRLFAGAIAIHLAALPALPLTSSDLFSHLSYARLSHLGRNSYRTGPADLPEDDPRPALVDPRWLRTPMVYGPVTALLARPIGGIESLSASLVAFKLEMLLTALLAVLLAYGFCRSCLSPGSAGAAFVFFAWNPLFAWEISAQAHTEGLVLIGLTVFVWAALRGREWLAVLGAACAFYSKIVLLPLLGLYLCFVARRRPLQAAAMAAMVAAIGIALFAPFWDGPRTLQGPLATLLANDTLTARSLTDFAVWVIRLLGLDSHRQIYRVAVALGTALLGAVGIRAVLRARSVPQVLRDGLVFYLLYDLVAAPWFQSWYALWLFPLALAQPDPRWRTLVAVYSVLLLVQYGIPLDPVTYVAIDAVTLVMLWRLIRSPAPVCAECAGCSPPTGQQIAKIVDRKRASL
jgi:hypothetical protein